MTKKLTTKPIKFGIRFCIASQNPTLAISTFEGTFISKTNRVMAIENTASLKAKTLLVGNVNFFTGSLMDYFPGNSAFLFCKNAWVPSLKSSVSKHSPN